MTKEDMMLGEFIMAGFFKSTAFKKAVLIVIWGVTDVYKRQGYIIKNMIPSDKINRFIPLIMGILGVVLNVWVNMDFTAEILLAGLFSGLSSTGLYELFRNLIGGNTNDLQRYK